MQLQLNCMTENEITKWWLTSLQQNGIGGPLFDFALVPRHGRATAGVAPLHGVWYHGDGGGGLLL